MLSIGRLRGGSDIGAYYAKDDYYSGDASEFDAGVDPENPSVVLEGGVLDGAGVAAHPARGARADLSRTEAAAGERVAEGRGPSVGGDSPSTGGAGEDPAARGDEAARG